MYYSVLRTCDILTSICCIVTACKRSLRRLCFHRCRSVQKEGGICPIACWDTPPGPDPPPESDPPGADTSPGADTLPVTDTPPEQTPSQSRQPPRAVHAGRYGQQAGGTHPTGMHTCCLWEQTANYSENYLLGSFYFDSTEKYFSCQRKDGHRRPALFNQ